MTDGGARQQETAEKSLGEIVSEVSEKASFLVREEIELARAEVTQKVSRLGRGAAVGAAAGLFAFLSVFYLLHALAYVLWDIIDDGDNVWIGYFIVTGILLGLGVVAGFLAYRFFKRGTPPKPEAAIEEARRTREALEEARSQ